MSTELAVVYESGDEIIQLIIQPSSLVSTMRKLIFKYEHENPLGIEGPFLRTVFAPTGVETSQFHTRECLAVMLSRTG